MRCTSSFDAPAFSKPPHPERRAATRLESAVVRVLDGILVAYQRVISPAFPSTCRFEPTCSQYARDAVRTHGPLRGVVLALRRLSRCHPFGGAGYDPVRPAGGDHNDLRRNG